MFSVHREFIGEDAGITWKTKDDKTDVSDLEETHNERKRKEKTRYLTLIFDIKENEWTYNRQLIYQQIYIMNV